MRECRKELAAFGAAREILPELAAAPEVPWNRLAAEMKANIRLGLAAGECVRAGERRRLLAPLLAGARAAVAFASVVVLVAAGLVLERPSPGTGAFQGVEVQATANGIQVREGGRRAAAVERRSGGERRDLTTGAQGSMGARYVDSETGYVTVTNVYAN